MKSKIFLLVLVVPLLVAGFQASATPPGGVLPEKDGVYDVPGRPNWKLRVFVHPAKPERPGTSTPPQLVCGATSVVDPDSSSTVAGAGWVLPSAWVYALNPSSVPGTVGSANLATIAANAFSVWESPVGPAVSVTRGADTSVSRAVLDGQNIITWGRTSGSALGVSYIWYQSGVAMEVDTIFNKKFTWYWSNPATWPSGETCAYSGVYDAQDILTHELGHTFGLDDMYTAIYAANTMYGYGSKGETKKNTLTSGDIAGVELLY